DPADVPPRLSAAHAGTQARSLARPPGVESEAGGIDIIHSSPPRKRGARATVPSPALDSRFRGKDDETRGNELMAWNHERPFVAVNIALLTVSDTRSFEDDRSGNTLQERAETAGHKIAARKIVRDEMADIVAQLKAWIADPEIDVVISTGGTGVTG